jgi:hypothetical protein
MLTCRLLKLHCYISDESEDDEVFIKRNKENLWPQSEKYKQMSGGAEIVNVDINDIERGASIELELWDYDTWSPNDKLGIFKMVVDERGGPFTSDLIVEKGSGAKYSLEWEVV